jgi:hypothetical protein
MGRSPFSDADAGYAAADREGGEEQVTGIPGNATAP